MISRRFSPRRHVHPAAALVLALALIACGASDSNELDADALPRLVAEPEVRIGDFDDPDIGFSRVFGVDVDRDGLIYVLEGLDTQIRVYDLEGRLLRRIGGPGEGPGEFGRAPSFGVIGDTVWAYDAQLGRITLFDRAGTVLSTGRTTGVRIPLAHAFGYVLPRAMRPDGRFTSFFGRVASSRDDPETGVAPTDPIPVPRVLFDATGAVVDTIGWDDGPPPRMVPPPGSGEGRFQFITVGSRRLMVPDPPPDLAQWVTLHDGRIVVNSYAPVTADEATFTVTRIGLASDTLYARTFHFRPIAYTPADLDSIALRGARGGPVPMGAGPSPAAGPETAAAQRALRAAMKFPEFRPAIRYPWLANDERLWLQRDEPDDDATVRWLILEVDGRPVGELELPRGLRVLWSRGDTFWATEPDQFDVPWLVRYRIARD